MPQIFVFVVQITVVKVGPCGKHLHANISNGPQKVGSADGAIRSIRSDEVDI